jgi:hypothetical protein
VTSSKAYAGLKRKVSRYEPSERKTVKIPNVLAVVALLINSTLAMAVDPFGFAFGMTPSAAEKLVNSVGMGSTRWLGKSLMVQGQDDPNHSYLVNFCENKLFSVMQSLPGNFDRMASFVDDSIRDYGQPMYVSARGSMTPNGYIRPINLYWKIGADEYVRLMEMGQNYAIVYEKANPCGKSPN